MDSLVALCEAVGAKPVETCLSPITFGEGASFEVRPDGVKRYSAFNAYYEEILKQKELYKSRLAQQQTEATTKENMLLAECNTRLALQFRDLTYDSNVRVARQHNETLARCNQYLDVKLAQQHVQLTDIYNVKLEEHNKATREWYTSNLGQMVEANRAIARMDEASGFAKLALYAEKDNRQRAEQKLDDMQDRVTQQRANFKAVVVKVNRQTVQMAELREERDSTKRKLEELQAERDNTQRKLEELQADHDQLRAERDKDRAERSRMLAVVAEARNDLLPPAKRHKPETGQYDGAGKWTFFTSL